MTQYEFSYERCFEIVKNLLEHQCSSNLSAYDIFELYHSCNMAGDMQTGDKYSEPMAWIGIYIAVASFVCIVAMASDLLHGFRNRKFWFPSKYFSLNAASITVIVVAMKLPVDLSSAMPGYVNQATKLGSLGFMCSMMANLMPSLASMDNKTLLANVIGLSILVITMLVNVCIQLNTRVIDRAGFRSSYFHIDSVTVAYIYMAMIILLLIIIISSTLTIPTFKKILDCKYQATNKLLMTDQQHTQLSRVEKLRRHVRRYWVMTETGSPEFVMASNPSSTVSGIICVLNLLLTLFLVLEIPVGGYWQQLTFASPYKWSPLAIFTTQSIGVVVGTIAPIFRCFSVFNFKLVNKWRGNHLIFFKVDKYWTLRLQEWKQSPIPFLPLGRKSRSLIFNSKNIILSLCIGFQKIVVVSSKLISLIAIVTSIIVANILYHWKSLKARWFTPSIASRTNDIDEDLSNYVLQIDNDLEIAEKTVKDISNSMNSFLLKAAKEQNNNLLELLEKSIGFKGVEMFYADHVQPLLPVEHVNSWSLSIVTLTCIAIALPGIPKDTVDNFFKSVGEGLSYTHLVEESLNCSSEYVNLRKASMALWQEVENKCNWLDNPLAKKTFKGKTAIEVLRWFSDKAKEIVATEINESSNGELVENPPNKLIAANSMYRITQTILLGFHSNIESITKKKLFAHLNGMIADIFSACFTNLPRVITTRCHENVIEKREASVKVAAKLLGQTTKIMEKLETCELPNMDDDKLAYIDEWRLYLKQSIP